MSRLAHPPIGCAHHPLDVSCPAFLRTQFSHSVCFLLPAIDSRDIQVFPVVPLVIQNPCVGVRWLLE